MSSGTGTDPDERLHAPVGASPAEIVVGVDGTYAACEALGWAARLARSTGSEVTAVYAWRPGLGELSSGSDRAARHELRNLRRWCRPVGDAGVDARTVVTQGQPDHVLVEAARSRGGARPRLLVLGRASPGSGLAHDHDHLCDRIARRLPAPMAVVPSPGAGRSLRRIVVGLDASASAVAAAVWSASVAAALDADIAAVTIFEPTAEWVPRSDPGSMWSKVRRSLEGPWTQPLRRRGVAFTSRVLEGTNVAASLTQFARDRHADAIVVGLGDTGWRRHPGTHLVDHSHLPVILVPADRTEGPETH
ncbi:MAG: universal stress protein [Acidimicrobiales bacterium]